jgi:hypothetical protein
MDVRDVGLLYLVRSVHEQTPDEIASKVDETFRIQDLGRDPAAFRGIYLRFAGTLDHLEPIWFPLDNPSGVENGYQGYILDRQQNLVHFIAIGKEGDFQVGHDTVMVEGRFYKIHSYLSNANKTISLPLLVAREIRAVPDMTYESAYPKHLGAIVVAIVVAAIVVIGLATWRASRGDAAMAQMRRSKRQQRRAREDPHLP